MTARTILAGLFAAGVLVGGKADAYVNVPTLLPQPLIAYQPIQMRVEYGFDHLLVEYPVDPAMFPRVTRSGQTIRVEMFGMDYSNTSPFDPIPPSERTVPLGSFPAGVYSVELVMASPLPGGAFEYTVLHTVPAVIRGEAEPVTLPTGNWRSAFLLSVGLVLLGIAAMRRHGGAQR
ncbi:MAG: hypothetical protein J0L88_13780 [Xanthomonadales bacterium]|nr:hypothetical protein [Xanthomonadales bacterium]